jgi:molybdopterin synthase catalytic subunit
VKRCLQIQTAPIDEAALLRERSISAGIGAVIYFLGVVREQEAEKTIVALEYETFQKMAMHQFGKIFDEVATQWPIESVRVVHRVGTVQVNEPSLWVEVTAPHRAEAFSACQFLIDEMKKVVPIWKRPLTHARDISINKSVAGR